MIIYVISICSCFWSEEKDVHRTDRLVPIYEPENMPNPNPSMVTGTNPNLEMLKDILVTYNRYNPELGA